MADVNWMLTFYFCFVLWHQRLCSLFPPLSCLTCLWFQLHFALKHTWFVLLTLIPDLARTTNWNNHILFKLFTDLIWSPLAYLFNFLSPTARSHSTVSEDTLLNDVQYCFCLHPIFLPSAEDVIVFSLYLIYLTYVCLSCPLIEPVCLCVCVHRKA